MMTATTQTEMVVKKQVIQDIPTLMGYIPSDAARPLILLSHGFTRDKELFREHLPRFAAQGYYVVAFDNRHHGERAGARFEEVVFQDGKLNLYELRRLIKETADDVRGLLDYFCNDKQIDAEQIGMLGISMGGFVTFRVLVIDARIKAAVPLISSPYWDDIPGGASVDDRPVMMRRVMDYAKQYSPATCLEAFYPRAILTQIGAEDQHYNAPKIKQFYSALQQYYASDPDRLKLIVHNHVAHEATPAMWDHAMAWFQRYV